MEEIKEFLDIFTKNQKEFVIKQVPKEFKKLEKYLEGHNGFIAGGCFKDIILDKEIKDVDIFFETEEDFEKAKEVFNSSDDFNFISETENMIAFEDEETETRVELINYYFGTVEETLQRFDFIASKVAMFEESGQIKVMAHEEAISDIKNKTIDIDIEPEKISDPFGTFERMLRYTSYGFKATTNAIVRVIKAVRLKEEFDEESFASKLGGSF